MARLNIYMVLAACCTLFFAAFVLFQGNALAWPDTFLQLHGSDYTRQAESEITTNQTGVDYVHLLEEVHNTTVHESGWMPEFITVEAGVDGIILDSLDRKNVTSPNGIYSLRLLGNGDLVLERTFVTGESQRLWWTGGGRRGKKDKTVLNFLKFNMKGVLEITRTVGQTTHRIWHSNLLTQCAQPVTNQWELNMATGQYPTLQLTNSGELSINGRCTIYRPPAKEEGQTLALIVSGLYRTLNQTCHQHVEKIAQNPQMKSVDIFVYALLEDRDLEGDITTTKIENDIRICYGPYLRSFTLAPVGTVESRFPGTIDSHCGDKLHRLYSQLKTVYMGAQAWQNWTIQTGALHDTVLRVRTDNNFWGNEKLHFEMPRDLGPNTLVIPHLMGDELRQFYCPTPEGNWYQGTGDQIAYGSPAAMNAFLTMYNDFPLIIDRAAPGKKAHHDLFGCESMPSGPLEADCKDRSTCSIECIVFWYLHLRGMQVQPEWTWNCGMLRG